MQLNDFNDYSNWTDRVAIYPKTAEPFYLALGIAEEVAELAGTDNPQDIIAEAGDVLWYSARYSRLVLNVPFAEIVATAVNAPAPRGTQLMLAVGAICGVEKKRLRDGETWDVKKAAAKRAAAIDGLITVVRGVLGFSDAIGVPLITVARLNQDKLTKRLEESKLQGDGSNR